MSGPLVAVDPTAFEILADRYTFFATANDHSLDFDGEGISSTIQALRNRKAAFHGINETEEDAEHATIMDVAGFRVGMVSHTFGTNGRRPPRARPKILNHTKLNRPLHAIDFGVLSKQLAHAKRHDVDFVIAQLHWGMEFERYPRPHQIDVAHQLAESGVDVIIGHHPHVAQAIEYYRTLRDPYRVVPIYYSLGNLTNPFGLRFMLRSAIARIVLSKGVRRDGVRATYVRDATSIEVEQRADHTKRTIALSDVHRREC